LYPLAKVTDVLGTFGAIVAVSSVRGVDELLDSVTEHGEAPDGGAGEGAATGPYR
jgi:hypothetical protein